MALISGHINICHTHLMGTSSNTKEEMGHVGNW